VTDVVLATLAAAVPMGQQEYEQQLLAHLPETGLAVRGVRVRSLRSSLPGEARLPLRALGRAPAAVQRVVARAAYGRASLVHRCDLRLPAARHEVVTVHDLAPLRFADEGEIPPSAAASLRRAAAVICVSQFAAGELRELLNIESPRVIYNGLDESVWKHVPPEVLDGLDVPSEFVLHSGGATRRKNLEGLADAWRIVAGEHPTTTLLMCGPPDPRRAALFADLPRVRMLGRVPRPVHLALMSAASVVVVPSTYEGFGFPALEAMARGTAVVAADRGALSEICAQAASLTEPDGASLAAAIAGLLRDSAARERLVALGAAQARKFSWDTSAGEHAHLYAACLAQ
jgi:glycosyltransferase involved in cell wall biosynthesis